jgi:hypothetical protein
MANCRILHTAMSHTSGPSNKVLVMDRVFVDCERRPLRFCPIVILRSWNTLSSARCATLTMVVAPSSLVRSFIR